mgnify:CR=1 FL=1
MRRWMIGTAAAAMAVVLGSVAAAEPQVTVTTETTTNAETGITTVRVTVTVSGLDTQSNQRWKDLHLLPIQGSKFPKITSGTQTAVDDGPEGAPAQTWPVRRAENGGRLDVYSGSQSGFSNGTYAFDLNVADIARCHQLAIAWRATSDGNANHENGVIATSAGAQAPNFPQLNISAHGGDDVAAPVGQATEFECAASSFAGASYEVYTARTLNAAYNDPFGLGINHPSDPVPASWNLTFQHTTGTLDGSGLPPQAPRVVVPNNPGLVGQVFFVVLAVKNAAGEVDYASAPVRVELTAP